MIGNEQNIRCPHKGLLDIICIQKDGSRAKHMGNQNSTSTES